MSTITADDREFLRSFEACAVAKSCWTHEAHVRMAWIVLASEENFTAALERIRRSIQRFNTVVGSTGYHETITVAFTRLIHYRRQVGDARWNYEDFARHNPDLAMRSPFVLGHNYSSDLLAQPQAKDAFVEPDKKPLPLDGLIRPVEMRDAEAMLRIYAPYVENTATSFEVTVPTLEDFSGRVREVTSTHPWLVFETGSAIAGYAYGSKHRARAAYQWTTEVSVYVSPEAQGRGVGRLLYGKLFDVLANRGYRLALGGITLPNAASVALHESVGFEPVGIYCNIGFKFGRWHDVGWWQRPLGDGASTAAAELTK